MEILAECDTSPKQQLESWVKYQSQSTTRTFLSPSEPPAMKDASPLVNLLRVCYLEEWEGKGAAWDCHIHWWTCRYIHPEGTCMLFTTLLWMNRSPPTPSGICRILTYPCILTLSSVFVHLLQLHWCGFSISDKTSNYNACAKESNDYLEKVLQGTLCLND